MSVESNARQTLGFLFRSFREKNRWMTREKLASKAGVDRQVIINLEHGVKNPSRQEFLTVMKILKLPAKETGEARRLINIIYRRRRHKFHLHISILHHRNRSNFRR